MACSWSADNISPALWEIHSETTTRKNPPKHQDLIKKKHNTDKNMSSSSRENQLKIIRKSREKIKGKKMDASVQNPSPPNSRSSSNSSRSKKNQKQKPKHQGEKRKFSKREKRKGKEKDCYLRRPMMGRKQHAVQQHLSVWKLQTKRTEPTTDQSCKNKTRKGWREIVFL